MSTRGKGGVGRFLGLAGVVAIATVQVVARDLELGRRPSLEWALALLGADLAALGLCAVVAAVLDRAGSAARSEPASRASAPPALPQLALDVDATQATLTVPATPDAMKRSS